MDELLDDAHPLRVRLLALEREWHTDRALMLLTAVLGAFAAHRGRRSVAWRLLFWLQMGSLARHAIRGHSAPVTLLRKLGFRTTREIHRERVTLTRQLASAIGP